MRSHYYKLKKVMENCIETVADEMYSKGLINREVCKVPTFEKMEVEFSALMSLYTDDVSKLEELCSLYLSCIASVEGPAKKEAIALAKDWEFEVFKSHQISLSLTKTIPEVNPKEVQLSSKDQLAKELQNLQKRYALLITDIITHYATIGKYDTLRIARWVQNNFDETGLVHDGVTIDEIFERMKPHYSFLDIESINDLMEAYPIDDTDLRSRFDQYAEDLDSFIDSAKLDNVITAVKAAIIGEGTKVDPKVILKLSGKWSDKTIRNLKKLTEYLFGEEAKHLTIKKLLSGSIQIQFLVSSYKIVSFLIERAKARVHFMHHFGIFQMTINDQTIVDGDENANFCFEESLQVAITNIININGIKDESMVLFLSQLATDINYQNEQGNTALMLASEGGQYHVVKLLLLHKDLNINIQNKYGWIALMFASCYENHQVVELLLSKNPDINIQNINGWTALMLASANGHHQVVKLLLSKHPNINIQDNDGVTALIFASANGNHQVVKLLLSKDPDINIQNNNGWTALMYASHYGQHQVVELLLNKNPDFNIQNNDGWTALMLACRNGYYQVVELLLSKDPDINIHNNGWTALMLASRYDHHQVVELLMSKYPDINIQNYDGWTALMLACRNGFHQVVELLLSKNPDINIQNNGWTAMMLASRYGHHQVVELLLSNDSDINIQNNDGVTALIFASAIGHHQVVELLLKKDPDINIQINDGWTALMLACRYGHHQVVELLLNNDRDINIQNNDGMTALIFASANGHHQVVELLLSKDPNINIQNNDEVTALIIASANGHHQVVELLLSKDPDIIIKDNDGWTALMAACCNGHHQVVELLLSKNFDINIQNNDGWTAVMLACRNGHHQVVELLLNKDPEINIQINDGWTALMLACRNGHYQVVKLLLSKNPDINIQNNDGVTALIFASANGHHQVVELLLRKDPDINIQTNGVTALMLACRYGHHQVVELLLSSDPDIKIQKKCDISMEDIISAFTIAFYEGHSSVVVILSKKLKILSSDERKLLDAAAEGDIGTLVSMLFEVGMTPDTPLVCGITPLMIAASCGHIDIVDTLIQAGADANKTNDEGKTALDILSGKKEESISSFIINLLITNGATAAQANPTQSLFKDIFSPSSNLSLIRSMSKTSTDTVERPAQINEPAQKIQELSENELAQYSQQH